MIWNIKGLKEVEVRLLSMLKRMNGFRVVSLLITIALIINASMVLTNPFKGNSNTTVLLISLLFLFLSISEYKEKKKRISLINFIVFLFASFVYIYSIVRQ
ncbi:DUF3953 domain-containing protein [Paenibacillus alba]|uniref:DUF3953 domain-containing protein n=1 Tax=Paenibacillus alba TaxID=1197127 RepID=UPI003B847091